MAKYGEMERERPTPHPGKGKSPPVHVERERESKERVIVKPTPCLRTLMTFHGHWCRLLIFWTCSTLLGPEILLPMGLVKLLN